MYLYNYRLLPYLPNELLILQWRYCLKIINYWGKGGTISNSYDYIKKHDRRLYYYYVRQVADEMKNRNIKINMESLEKVHDFCNTKNDHWIKENYPEQDEFHLRECLYKFEEKARLGKMDKNIWTKIYNDYKDFTPLWFYDKNVNYDKNLNEER